jgi:DNA polymerase bacteriophage-type
MTRYCHIDFETRSVCDLRKAGAWRYAEDRSTEVLCLCWHDGAARVWLPGESTDALATLAADPDCIFVAHNAQFEQAIWQQIMVEQYGLPPIPVKRWEDTMASAAHMGLPLALDDLAKIVGAEKDKAGYKLMMHLCKPAKPFKKPSPPFIVGERDDPTKPGFVDPTPYLQRLVQYCHQDVEVERVVERKLGLLRHTNRAERAIWLKDQEINQRGVCLDMEFVSAALEVIERATDPLLAEFRKITGGIAPGQVAKVREWIAGQWQEIANLQMGTIDALLGTTEEEYDISRIALPENVRRALEIRRMLGSVSIKKLKTMQTCVGDDGRARGLLQYHAASTGRWGGRLIQPQNFPRGDDGLRQRADPSQIVDAIQTEDPEWVDLVLSLPAIEAVASALRHAIIPGRGKTFLVGDFAGIEMRIVLALAGQHDKCELLASGRDVYLDMACDIYGRPRGSFTKDNVTERQIGKNTVLGCGFQMGWPKFRERYCPDQPEEFAQRVVDAYRNQWAPMVPRLWYALGDAALSAARGCPATAYGVRYQLEDGFLTATLPSGWQKLWYYAPQLGRDEKFNKDCWSYTAIKNGHAVRVKAYGGLLTENVVQALARGLLVSAIGRLERAGMSVVLTVHDEIVCEVPHDACLEEFESLMATPTTWAKDMRLPIAVEAWQGDRYRK